jgi:hypothetical protein
MATNCSKLCTIKMPSIDAYLLGILRTFHNSCKLHKSHKSPFHGDNTGSNPVGDAKPNKRLIQIISILL